MSKIDGQYISVNYHYVEDPGPLNRGIVPCSVEEFRRQVKFLAENYRLVSIPEVLAAARVGKKEKFCAITFDDGLKNQYLNALPILEKYRAAATFFIITGPFSDYLPAAHKVHSLLSQVSVSEIIGELNSFLGTAYPELNGRYFVPQDRRLTQKRLHEDVPTANFKETMIALPLDIRDGFLKESFKKFNLDEKAISSALFMNKNEALDLPKLGMFVGGHSHRHYALNVLDEAALVADLDASARVLREVFGELPETFSYPHGRSSEMAIKHLKTLGFKYAVTIDRRPISSGEDPFLIPRYDTGDLKISNRHP